MAIVQDEQRILESGAFKAVRKRVIELVLMTTVPINILLLAYQLGTGDFEISTVEFVVRVAYGVFGFVGIGLLLRNRYVFAITQITLLFAIMIMTIPENPVQLLAIAAFTLIISSIFAHDYLLAFAVISFLQRLISRADQVDEAGQPLVSGFSVVLTILLVLSAVFVLRYFSTRIRRTVAADAAKGAELLEVANTISHATRTATDHQTLFNEVIMQIHDRLGYYHAQVFLVDSNNSYANLVASTGDVGKELLRRGHQLAVGSRSVIGRVTSSGVLVVARTSEHDSVHSRNELLPNTRSELAIPLRVGETIVGALDVQSTRFDAFEPEEVKTLQVIANQLSMAVQNTRSAQMREEIARENQRLQAEIQNSSREIERLNREIAGTAWRDFLKSDAVFSGIAVEDAEEAHEVDWTPQMLAASQNQAPVIEEDKVAMPIVLRGHVLGAIEVGEFEDVRRDDALDVIQSVMERLAVRLENTRLFQEAQETTAQEQRINEIVSEFQTAKSVDDLLQITLRELGETFGAESGMIRLTGGDRVNKGDAGEQNGYQQNGDHSA